MSANSEIKKRGKLSKTETLKELNFDLKSHKELTEPKVKSEKLYRKKKSKSSSNVREYHKQRFKVSKHQNVDESADLKHSTSSPKLRTVKSSDSFEKTEAEQKKFLSESTSSFLSNKCSDKKVNYTNNEDPLQLIRYSERKYWSEGFTGDSIEDIMPPTNENNVKNMFSIQAFNFHLMYETLFKNVPHVNFIGFNPDIGHILLAITKIPVDKENNAINPKTFKKQASDKSLKESNASLQNSDDSPTKSKSPSSPRLSESGGIRRALSGLFSSKTIENQFQEGYHHVLVRSKIGDKLIKIPSEKPKVKKSKLLNMLLDFNPPVGFDLSNVDFKEINVPFNKISEMEQKLTMTEYKFGVIYSKEGQYTDDEMLSNLEGSQQFYEFLDTIAEKVELNSEWPNFTGGLDICNSYSGKHSYYTKLQNYEIMFHVSTLLPYSEGDEQQVERKRHIGNDVVVIIFQDGDTIFDPESIKSVFNHVFIVVRKCKDESIHISDDQPTEVQKNNDSCIPNGINTKRLSKHSYSDSTNECSHTKDLLTDDTSVISGCENFSSDELSDDTFSQYTSDEVISNTSTKKEGFKKDLNGDTQNSKSKPIYYRIEIVSKKGVKETLPKLPNPPIISSTYLREFLLTKMINCERAAYFSPNFSKPLERAREMLLKEFYESTK